MAGGDEAGVVGSALMHRCLAAWQLHPALFWVACGGRALGLKDRMEPLILCFSAFVSQAAATMHLPATIGESCFPVRSSRVAQWAWMAGQMLGSLYLGGKNTE